MSAGGRCTVVVGTGLIGASIGLALSTAGRRVHLQDASASHAQVAAGLGAGTLAVPVAAEVELVVVAVPPSAIAGVVLHCLQRYPSAAVTDVGSVKAGVLDSVWRSRADLGRYVGSHPMAGSQHSGPVTAHAELFDGRTWVVAPHRRSSAEHVQRVVELVQTCGARMVLMDVDDHDAAVARVSHLPHLMSVLMAGHLTGVGHDDLLLAGQGLRDVTRIAGGDPALWEQILSANSAAVLAELRTVADELEGLIAAVESAAGTAADPAAGCPAEPAADPAGLRSRLARAVEGTRRIPGKHGAAPVSYQQVVVEIPDTPGALGRLFADVGAAGVNVEDIAIEHDPARQLGYLAISVAPGQAAELATAMATGGWSAAP